MPGDPSDNPPDDLSPPDDQNDVCPDSKPRQPSLTLAEFLTSAAIFEGVLLLIAYVAGWAAGVNPTGLLSWSFSDLWLGVLFTIPMLLALAVCYLWQAPGIREIRIFLRETIGPYLDQCRLIDLALLALMAGVCEEVLFRGFLYVWIQPWNPVLAILICNLLFGVAHAVTPVYAMIAGLVGLYLTALVSSDPTPNLLIPITAHTTYDFIAFLVVLRDFRKSAGQDTDK